MNFSFSRPNSKIVLSAKTSHLVSSGVFFLCGIFLILAKQFNIEQSTLAIIVGAVNILIGATGIFGYFSNDSYRLVFQSDFAIGTFDVVFGVMLILRPANLSELLPCAIGIITLLEGGNKGQIAVEGKRFGISKWFLVLISSLIEAGFGALSLILAGKQLEVAITYAGITMAVVGAINFWTTMYMVHVSQKKESK